MLKFAIIGAGAGGQSMAAILTDKGYTIFCLTPFPL